MRLLSIGLLYPPHHLGGYELVAAGVDDAATRRGHEVRVLVSDHRMPGVSAAENDGSREIHRELRSYLNSSASKLARTSAFERTRIERHNAEVLERHLSDFVPDVVVWWAMAGMSLTLVERVRRAGLPAVVVAHDTWPVYAMAGYPWAAKLRRLRSARLLSLLEHATGGIPLRIELARSGRFLFNSEYTRDAVLAGGVRTSDSAVLTPGVSRLFNSVPAAPEWRGRLLYVGRIDPVKGIDLLLPALTMLASNASLRIVGAGNPDYERQLRATAANLDVSDRIEFLGGCAPSSLPSVYAAADAVLFPVRWQEPWGLVPLEAMAVGRAVVATAQGGATTYLRDGYNALVVPPEDPEALAAAVTRLGSDPQLRARLREGGLRTAAEHSADRYEQLVVDEFERVARRVSEQRPGSSRSAS